MTKGLGNVPIYVLPFTIPLGINSWQLYVAATLFILFADSFHKIGHGETKYKKLMWATETLFGLTVSLVFFTPTLIFVLLTSLLFISLIPFGLIKKKKLAYAYTQVWFGIAGFIGFYYYLYFVV